MRATSDKTPSLSPTALPRRELIPDASKALPLVRPPLMREHRLYQADWLMRFYGFEADEIASALPGGMLDPTLDPKLGWALANRAQFPLDVNRAPREMLLRGPGFGTKAVERILAGRRHRTLGWDDLVRIGASMKKAQPFVTLPGWSPGGLTDAENLCARFAPAPAQLSRSCAKRAAQRHRLRCTRVSGNA